MQQKFTHTHERRRRRRHKEGTTANKTTNLHDVQVQTQFVPESSFLSHCQVSIDYLAKSHRSPQIFFYLFSMNRQVGSYPERVTRRIKQGNKQARKLDELQQPILPILNKNIQRQPFSKTLTLQSNNQLLSSSFLPPAAAGPAEKDARRFKFPCPSGK
jgi:hypothetical protein